MKNIPTAEEFLDLQQEFINDILSEEVKISVVDALKFAEDFLLENFDSIRECAVKSDGIYFKHESFEQFKKK